MITSIQGTLASVGPLAAVIELNGLGYEVNVPVTTAEKLPLPGAQVKLHTVVIYREDAQVLYGFATPDERDFFRLMIDHVTGVGPKVALGIISRLPLPRLLSAIRTGDVATLAQSPGIGRKTAERLVVELKARLGQDDLVPAAPGAAGAEGRASPQQDAVSALVALGYKPADADQAVRKALRAVGAGAGTEALIKRALAG